MRRWKKRLAALAAALALTALSGCAGEAEPGARSVPGFGSDVAACAAGLTVEADSELDSGTAVAAMYALKNDCAPAEGEACPALAGQLQEGSGTAAYNKTSLPAPGETARMSRLFIYPGEWSEEEAADQTARLLREMDDELPDRAPAGRSGLDPDSYIAYTYRYAASARAVYDGKTGYWVVGVGVTQTATLQYQS